MSYDMVLKAKVERERHNKYVHVADGGGITWNVHELIEKSSGWTIKNEANNGLAEDIGKLIERGIYELETSPEEYEQYESPNGWGTIDGTLNFYRYLLEACKEYPYAYVFVY